MRASVSDWTLCWWTSWTASHQSGTKRSLINNCTLLLTMSLSWLMYAFSDCHLMVQGPECGVWRWKTYPVHADDRPLPVFVLQRLWLELQKHKYNVWKSQPHFSPQPIPTCNKTRTRSTRISASFYLKSRNCAAEGWQHDIKGPEVEPLGFHNSSKAEEWLQPLQRSASLTPGDLSKT